MVTGKSWDDYLAERIFKPLGMNRTLTSTLQLATTTNIAMPHTEYKDKVISIPYLNWDNIAPAGSIISSASDMAKWLQLQLNKGKFKGQTIFSKEAAWEMWSPNTIEKVSERSARLWPSTHFKAYALGWAVFDYKGCKIISHNGGYDGMISNSILIPEKNIGFIILTNANSMLYYPLIYTIMDEFITPNEKNFDWMSFFMDYKKLKKQDELNERKEWEAKRIKNTKPSLALSEYCGTYNSELYGKAEVKQDGNSLKVSLLPSPKFVGNLTHWHYDTFEIVFPEFPSLPPGTVNFVIDKQGKVEEMRIDVPNPDFDFTELKFFKE